MDSRSKAADCILQAGRKVLKNNKKIATGKTIKSLQIESSQSEFKLSISLSANKGWLFIEKGKRANTKLPVVPGSFNLVPELQEWADAVNFGGSDYQLAYTIAKKPRKGIDLTGQLIAEITPKFDDISIGFASEVIPQYFSAEVKRILL